MNNISKNEVLRYENKYLIRTHQLEQIRIGLEALCFKDKNVGADGQYHIRSLYFDDYRGSSFRDNEMGIEPRSKFRIRIYDCEENFISLERKMKIGGKILKRRTRITKSFLDAVMAKAWEQIDYPSEDPLINQFMMACYAGYLRPVIIVDYDREPYVFAEGDVRITFDTNIGFSDDFENFFEIGLFVQPILPVGTQLLEVKYTEFLPKFIYEHLNLAGLKQSTFSKYYLCEKNKRMRGY